MAAAPSISVMPLAGVFSLDAPVLVGVSVRRDESLVLGPQVVANWYRGDRKLEIDPVGSLLVGATAGYTFKVVPTVELQPEVGILAPVAGAAEGSAVIQVGLGVSYRGRL